MSFGTISIDPGNAPSVAIASDTISSAVYQRIKQANPNADQTGAYGIDADPVRVRPRRRGTSDWDTGLSEVPTAGALVAVISGTVYPEGGFITNVTDQVQWFTLTNTAGREICSQWDLQPRETRELPFKPGASYLGLKWRAKDSATPVITAHMWGAQ
jgi:hypothetical protein